MSEEALNACSKHNDSVDLFDLFDLFDVTHTRCIIQILKIAGFISHTADYVRYLFFRPALRSKGLKKEGKTKF